MLRSALTVLITLLLAVPVFATTVAALSFEQLVNESSAVVYGRVIDVRSQWTEDRRSIESVVSIEILKGMKGLPTSLRTSPSTSLRTSGAPDTIAFTVPGGQVGRYLNIIPGAPIFAPGELAVFFLTAHGPRLPVTTGLTQGIYRVQRDARSGEMLVMPPVVEAGRIVRGDVRRKPASLAAFESSVKAITR